MEIEIHDLAFGGAGVGRLNDLTVFVYGAIPGDTVEARIKVSKKNYAEAELVRLIKPSSQRIKPRCKHFETCGGCSLQQLEYKDQIKWKQKMVEDAIIRIGEISCTVEDIIGCETPWFYRNKMEYSFGKNNKLSEKQTLPANDPAEKDLKLGLHPPKKFYEVFDLEECFLHSELSPKIVCAVRDWAHGENLSFYHDRRNDGQLRNLIVRDGKNTEELMVNLVINGNEEIPKESFIKIMLEKFPQITSLYLTGIKTHRGRKTKREETLLFGKPSLTETLKVSENTLRFDILPQAFFQPNTKQAEILYEQILAAAELENAKLSDAKNISDTTVLDLFCGTGTIGMFFAKNGYKVHGIEVNSQAIESARENAKQNEMGNIEFHCGDVGAILSEKNISADIVITDPPRAGIEEKSLMKILALKIPTWIYVSCNPTTLARDLKIAQANGYTITKIQPVDMFPHTFHVETVVSLELWSL